jgi:hypothetical protein
VIWLAIDAVDDWGGGKEQRFYALHDFSRRRDLPVPESLMNEQAHSD